MRPGCTRVRVVTTECAALTAGARHGPSQASERESKEVKVMAGSSQAHQADEGLWAKLEQSILLSLSDIRFVMLKIHVDEGDEKVYYEESMICSKLLNYFCLHQFSSTALSNYITIQINITNDLTLCKMLTRNIIIALGIKSELTNVLKD